MIFQYMMLTVFFCYLALAGMKKYRKWTLHYVWTIPYIVYSFMINVFRIENIYVNNFGEIAKAILLWYGIKRIYDLLRSEEHTSELQSRQYLVCRLLLEQKKT